jgi:hypothetical protein
MVSTIRTYMLSKKTENHLLWALLALIQDRADVLPSYQQFIGQLKDKVRFFGDACHSVLD